MWRSGTVSDGVVGALAVHVGTQKIQQPVHVRIGERHHVIHAFERGHDLRAIGGAENRPAAALQPLDGPIIVDGDHKAIRLGRGAGKIPRVAHVKHVEAAVRERHSAARRAIRADQLDQLLLADDPPQATSRKSG